MDTSDVQRFRQEAHAQVEEEAQAVINAPWPEPEQAGTRVYACDSNQSRCEPLEPEARLAIDLDPPVLREDPGLSFDRKGMTFLDAIALGLSDALRADPRVFIYG